MTKNITAKIICHIINLAITHNIIPFDWKSDSITPIFMEGDRHNPANYQPISVLPSQSKIMERVIHKQLFAHIQANKILSEAQFGFRKYHSTTTCILSLLDEIYSNMENNKLTGVVFLDLKKAFSIL